MYCMAAGAGGGVNVAVIVIVIVEVTVIVEGAAAANALARAASQEKRRPVKLLSWTPRGVNRWKIMLASFCKATWE